MFESKYNKLLTVVLIIVIVAILGLLGFLAFNFFQEQNNTEQAANFVDNYDGDDLYPEDTNKDNNEENNNGSNPLDNLEEVTTGAGSTRRTRKMYNGFYVAGTIRIPKTNVSYPVLEDLSKSALENSVVLIYGAGLNQVGNTVIIGHNYRNGQFFSNNKKLNSDDKVYIKDNDGNEKSYTIYSKFETTPEDTSFYQRDTNGKAEITLSTCTDDSSARLIILARED
ncbi:MAG: sortase [Clostridia bacterium]|nr:sortase [Clostridia bacterium]